MIARFRYVLWTLLVVTLAFGLYMVKYRVQAIQAEIADVNQQLQDERENLRVAEAEWAYLTQPERLQRLSAHYLRLRSARPQQLAGVEAVPFSGQGEGASVVTPASLAPAEGE